MDLSVSAGVLFEMSCIVTFPDRAPGKKLSNVEMNWSRARIPAVTMPLILGSSLSHGVIILKRVNN